MAKATTVQVTWTSAAKMRDANGDPLKAGETGPLDKERAESLQRRSICKIADDTDAGGGPDLDGGDTVATQEPDDVTDADEGTDGSN